MIIESFNRIATDFDVVPLQVALKRQPKLFGKFNLRAEGYSSPHSKMTDIWVRYNDATKYLEAQDFTGFNDEHDSVWYPSYYSLPQIRDIVFKLMALVEGERLGAVLITKLPPGGRIEKHVDSSWHAGYYDKYYIPIQNAEGSTFNFEDGVIAPKLGEVYWFDNSVTHWVENNSDEDRISLIICIKSDKVKGAGR